MTGSPLPAFAQTSNCPAGSSALSVFVEGSGSITIRDVSTELVAGTTTNYPTGVTTTVYSGCLSECFNIMVLSIDAQTVDTIVTLNGSVIYTQTFNNDIRFYMVNGATGGHDINANPPGCNFL